MDLVTVHKQLEDQGLDGWLIYDFRRCNDLGCDFLEIPTETFLTRRFFYWIPKQGAPIKLVSAVEEKHLDHLPGEKIVYRTWGELEHSLATLLKSSQKICMEYSPRNAVPYVSKVDAGTMDVVRECGVEVVSSADLLQAHTSVWTSSMLSLHLEAAQVVDEVVELAWQHIREALQTQERLTDYDVQQYILKLFGQKGCITESAPICALNADAANPHFSPSAKNPKPIMMGDFILIDLWCRKNHCDGTYADITRVGVASESSTVKQQEVFEVVKAARDQALRLVEQRFSSAQAVMGWEVDQAAREVIEKAGYGPYFVHRTGHNIGRMDHGNGANIDNLETQEQRRLLPGTCFSIEPGIYLPGEFGVRLEYDVYVHHDGRVQVTGGIQDALRILFP